MLEGALYIRYKKSTQRFKDSLQGMVPSEIWSDGVKAFLDAADHVVKVGMEVEKHILNDLKLLIRILNRVAVDKYDGGDAGRAHFLSFLGYCWAVISPSQKKPKAATPTKKSDMRRTTNSYGVLFTEDEDDDDNEEDLPSL
jgi:hypothetical protein